MHLFLPIFTSSDKCISVVCLYSIQFPFCLLVLNNAVTSRQFHRSTKFSLWWVLLSPYFRDHKTNISNRNPFEESDETRDHVEYKAMAYQRSKTSDNNPITYPPVILSCLNSTIMGELCACAADRHKITSRGVCFLPSQCAPCLPLREKGLMLAWYCIRHPQ